MASTHTMTRWGTEMTPEKAAIIRNAVDYAVKHGTGICSSVARELTDAGYYYNTEAEDYAIEYWASMHPPHDLWKEEMK